MSTRKDILNAFQPAREIEDPRRFAGRRTQMSMALNALLTDGAHLFLYGDRGIGKSSFALQVLQVAQGKRTLIDALGLQEFATETFDFLCASIRCDDSILSIGDLLSRILADQSGLTAWLSDEARRQLEKPATPTSPDDHTPSYPSFAIQRFSQTVRSLDELGPARDGVLLMIDEFDRVRDRTGFASVLKALADTKLKCLVVGVADNLTDLITDHSSLSRQMAEGSIKLPPMPDEELREIVVKAELALNHEYRFNDEARQRLIFLSRGQPYMLHLIGKWTLLAAYDTGSTTVQLQHLEQALQDIVTKGYETQYEQRYRTAVASSGHRESVLRAFAQVNKEKIHTSEAYAHCPDVGNDKAAVYLGHLRQEKYGAELVDRGNRYHEFHDALFKAYVNATPRRFPVASRDNEDH